MLKIKNWHKFQHFKDRRPPWIKLYADIVEDVEWFELDGDTAKALVSMWIIASQQEDIGCLPDIRTLSHRLRVSGETLNHYISQLHHWIIQVDDVSISTGYQDATPEKRREETETETEKRESATKPLAQTKSGTPTHFNQWQYATSLLEKTNLPETRGAIDEVAACIKAEAGLRGGLAQAYEFILAATKAQIELSGAVPPFWFRNTPWRVKVEEKPKPKPSTFQSNRELMAKSLDMTLEEYEASEASVAKEMLRRQQSQQSPVST